MCTAKSHTELHEKIELFSNAQQHFQCRNYTFSNSLLSNIKKYLKICVKYRVQTLKCANFYRVYSDYTRLDSVQTCYTVYAMQSRVMYSIHLCPAQKLQFNYFTFSVLETCLKQRLLCRLTSHLSASIVYQTFHERKGPIF